MKYFRVDKRVFAEGEVMGPGYDNNATQEGPDASRQAIEDMLDSSDKKTESLANGPTILRVFEELHDAVRSWILLEGAHIYLLKRIDGESKLFLRADLNINDLMFHTHDEALKKQLDYLHRAGVQTFKPRMQTQTNVMQVVKKLTTDDMERKISAKEFKDGNNQVEAIKFYQRMLPLIYA